jgi:nucleoside-diphosphate-sugar epimerase
MDKKVALVTGANGEVGHLLLDRLASKGYEVIALDIKEIDPAISIFINKSYKTDITDEASIESILKEAKPDIVFHLAAYLSTAAEKDPDLAHHVNVDGTLYLLRSAQRYSFEAKKKIIIVFPSSIAVYGLPDLTTKNSASFVSETQFTTPITIYGITKLHAENLGIYFEKYYKLLNPQQERYIDFRALRFPGLISAMTIPSGGTSDYAPEMIHTLAQGQNYESFVREDTILPFMAMPDAIKALTLIAETPKEKLSQNVYNVSSFSISAAEIAQMVIKVFPETMVGYNPDPARQKIVDSWPANINDTSARRDWGWFPDFDAKKTFENYLIPEVTKKYSGQK